MVHYFETADRVFRCEIAPDGPGDLVRSARITVERGEPLTAGEAIGLADLVTAGLTAAGEDVECH